MIKYINQVAKILLTENENQSINDKVEARTTQELNLLMKK